MKNTKKAVYAVIVLCLVYICLYSLQGPHFLSEASGLQRQGSVHVSNDAEQTFKNSMTLVSSNLTRETTLTSTNKFPATQSHPVQLACPYQNVDPWYPGNEKHMVVLKGGINCTKGLPSLVFFEGDMIKVNTTKVSTTVGTIDYCRYARIELSGKNDRTLRKLKWSKHFLQDPIQLLPKDDNIAVECYSKRKLVGETFKIRLVEKTENIERYAEDFQRHTKENTPLETMNILVVGIDGMSKQNLVRTMPKTRDFVVNRLNGKELYKFNKVGDNTFPNMVVFHSGSYEEEVLKYWNRKSYFDEIDQIFTWHHYQNVVPLPERGTITRTWHHYQNVAPLPERGTITRTWHHYQKAGYRTSLMLDVTHISPFHYLKRGWARPPFDYYNAALSIYIQSHRRHSGKGNTNCAGDAPELNIWHDFLHQFTAKFSSSKKTPYFAFNFFTRLTHGNGSRATWGDAIYLEFFHRLERTNVLDNTVMIFFSDHGQRHGTLRNTFNGKIENNTPFVFFIFPTWFEHKYPKLMDTFRINQNRLTTFFDMYKTLMDLLRFQGKSIKGKLNSRSISLFDEIPAERMCAHADIQMRFCNCKTITHEIVPKRLSNIISSHVLNIIRRKTREYRKKCAVLYLKSIQSVDIIKSNERYDSGSYYQVTIETTPGGALYEALIKSDVLGNKMSLVSDITRINLYEGQDLCVDTRELKYYCFCKRK